MNTVVQTDTEKKCLPFSAPWFGSEEKQEIAAVLESDWITTGPRAKQFEQTFSEYTTAPESVALASCTAALHLAAAALGIGSGDAVITTPLTFAATANTVVHCGARPVFADILPDTYNLDPAKVREFIATSCVREKDGVLRLKDGGQRVRAITVVHYAGHPCRMEEFQAIAKEYSLAIIEDAAHALGAFYRGQHVGTFGIAGCFSFYPTKTICTGEGGMLTTSDPGFAKTVRRLQLHGISRDGWKRYSKEGSWQYDIEAAGFKYNMTDLAAALGIHQMRKLGMFLARREQIAKTYTAAFEGLPLQLPVVESGMRSAWHLYPVQVLSDRISRDELVVRLRQVNIGTSVHFIPLNHMSWYQKSFGLTATQFPVSDTVFSRIVSLPLFPRMADDDVNRVIEAVSEILAKP